MGLEFVELILEVEERFGVDIPDRVAGRLRTPKQLIEHVSQAVGATDEGPCVTQRSFYRTRKALMAVSSAERSQIRPETPLEDVLPLPTRKGTWRSVATALRARRISLRRPEWVLGVIAALGLAAFATGINFSRPRSLVVGGFAAFIVVAIALAATRPLANRLPWTVGDLARFSIPALATEPPSAAGTSEWTKREVAEVVRQAIRDQTGVQEFSDDADFIRDLDMG